MKPAPLIAAAAFFLFAVSASGQDAVVEESVTQESAAEPAVAAAEEKPAVVRSRASKAERRVELGAQIWWNQPKKVEEIGLSDEQRARMDAFFREFMENRGESKKRQDAALNDFGAALLEGDAEAIRQAGDQVAEAMADPIRRQTETMNAVVAVLSEEQRRELIERYPQLFSRLWVLSGDPRSLARRPQRRP